MRHSDKTTRFIFAQLICQSYLFIFRQVTSLLRGVKQIIHTAQSFVCSAPATRVVQRTGLSRSKCCCRNSRVQTKILHHCKRSSVQLCCFFVSVIPIRNVNSLIPIRNVNSLIPIRNVNSLMPIRNVNSLIVGLKKSGGSYCKIRSERALRRFLCRLMMADYQRSYFSGLL